MVHWDKPRPALSGLFGRAAELAALALCIEGADRLVTLTGGPGSGKTRLGEALFEATADPSAWTGGRWFARLSALSLDPVEAVCSSLGLASVPGVPPVERVGAHLASLGRVLLVIDGLEHGLSEARRSLATWLAAAPGLSIVATSREALGLPGEACAVVGPLDDDAALALFTRLSVASGWGEAARRGRLVPRGHTIGDQRRPRSSGHLRGDPLRGHRGPPRVRGRGEGGRPRTRARRDRP